MIAALRLKITQIFQSENFQRYLKNTSWLLGERMISMGVAFVVGALVARHLGPEQMGVLAYGMSLVGFMGVFIMMGLDSTLTRNLVQEPDNTETILGSALGLRAMGSLLTLLILLGVIIFVDHDLQTVMVIGILMVCELIKGGQVLYNYYESRVITKFDARIKLVSLVISSVFRLSLIFIFSASVVWFAISYVLVEGINLIGQLYVFQNNGYGRLRKWRFDRKYATNLMRDSWPLVFSALLASLYMQIDQVMIKHMLDDAQTGIYYTAVKFSTIFFFVPLLINRSVSPAVYEAKKGGHTQYINRLRQLMSLMVGVTLVIVVGVVLFGQLTVDFVYGEEFTEAGPILVVHVWSLLFIAIGSASTTYLMAEKLEKLRLYRTLLGAIVNVGLNFWLIPTHGIMGAAIATLFSQAMASYLAYAFSKRTHEIFWIQTKALFLIDPIQQLRKEIRKR